MIPSHKPDARTLDSCVPRMSQTAVGTGPSAAVRLTGERMKIGTVTGPLLNGIATELEGLGYDTVLFTDNQGAAPDVWTALGHAAAQTTRVHLGTGVTNTLTRDVSVTADAALTLQALSIGSLRARGRSWRRVGPLHGHGSGASGELRAEDRRAPNVSPRRRRSTGRRGESDRMAALASRTAARAARAGRHPDRASRGSRPASPIASPSPSAPTPNTSRASSPTRRRMPRPPAAIHPRSASARG